MLNADPPLFGTAPAFVADEPSARAGYGNNPLDRKAEWRDDEARLASLQTATARMIVYAADKAVLGASPDFSSTMTIATAAALGATPDIFLGMRGDIAYFAGMADEESDSLKARGFVVIDLRSIGVQGLVSSQDLAILGHAKGILAWHATHPHCARCGARTTIASAGYRRECPSCKASHFPRTDPVAIMMVVRGDFCLLARKPAFAPGMYSCLAGFIEPGETLEDAVRRETLEEAGVRATRVVFHAAQPWPLPFSQLMMGCLAETSDEAITLERTELEEGRWFSRAECRMMLDNTHPQGLFCPPPMSIANLLLRDWLDGKLA